VILIVGAGGHGQVVADIFRTLCPSGELAFLDDDQRHHGLTYVETPVVGAVRQARAFAHDAMVVALGDNAVRARVFARLAAAGEQFAVAIHPRSIVARDVAIGRGTMISAGAIVNTGSIVGDDVIINTGATVDHHTVIGDHVHIAPGVHMGGDVRIGEGALIGIGAVVLPRVSIGAWSTVGAGAVVTKDVPPGTTVVGVPARAVAVAAGA
jgi:sugar O-acyltransferase (sialic acid O-acetyltransferase NeuD family)